MMKKSFYVTPVTIALVVRFEGNFMGSPDGYNPGGGGSYKPGEDINENGDF